MKNKIKLLIAAICFHTMVLAQAILPTSWGFATANLPTGWTQTGTTFYTASGNIPPACKFDNTGDSLTIHFASAPGNLTYYLAGNSFAGGTFLVQESVDGNTWTVLHTHTAPPAATYTLYTDVPNNASRYIRFYYQLKVSGNVGLDEVTIEEGAAGPAQEINVVQGASIIIDGATFNMSSPVSVNTPVSFTIQNLGTADTLFVSAININGVNASDFNIASFPDTILPDSNGVFTLDFTPAAAGTRIASIDIISNDADEATYTININGIGGSFATEPIAQPTALVFSNVKSYRFKATFTAASPNPDGYLVLRNDAGPVTDVPVDGVGYQRGDMIGSSKVVYSGTFTSFNPINIIASSTYNFAVFAFNGPVTYRNYLTSTPLAGSVTTLAEMIPPTYYTGVNSSVSSFVTDLHNKINPHTQQFYSNYGTRVVSLFAARDTADDQRVLTCVYSGENKVYTEPFDWTTAGYSREHTFCHDWMPTNPADGLPEYDDYHHLFPTNQDQANVIRLNYPLGEVVTATYTYLGCKFGNNAAGQKVFEPRDEHKGDAARAMMYESTCYTGVSGNLWSFPSNISGSIPYGQDQNVLKKWHYQDPPSKWEIARNDFIDSLQNNRNPFVDHPEYACYIDFSNMTYVSNPTIPCDALGLNKQTGLSNVYVAPNPAQNELNIYVNVASKQNANLSLIDVTGKVVLEMSINLNAGKNQNILSLSNINSGVYTLKITGDQQLFTQKIIKQ
jgi:hypothetical protein